MKSAGLVRLKVLSQPTGDHVKVLNVDTNQIGILILKNALKVDKDGFVRNAWLMRKADKHKLPLYGNSYFGRWDIRPNLQDEYLRVISALYKKPDIIAPEDISILKGMCNRCLRRDQWDWFTTYTYLGCPERDCLRRFVLESAHIRDELRIGNRNNLKEFGKRYQAMLASMQFFIRKLHGIDALDISMPPESLSEKVWNELSEDSRLNILIIEHCINEASQFVLMHFFVTLEVEFKQKLISPFLAKTQSKFLTIRCFDQGERQTHDILIGRNEMTLGSIDFLGRYIARPENLISSEVIRSYRRFCGSNLNSIVALCATIGNKRILGYRLNEMRNKLVHGDGTLFRGSEKVSLVCAELREFLLSANDGILERIVAISKSLHIG